MFIQGFTVQPAIIISGGKAQYEEKKEQVGQQTFSAHYHKAGIEWVPILIRLSRISLFICDPAKMSRATGNMFFLPVTRIY
jgi:hypothetical protein